MVILDKTHGESDAAPEECNEGQVATRTDVTNENCGGRLKDDVCDEKDEIGNVLFKLVDCPGC